MAYAVEKPRVTPRRVTREALHRHPDFDFRVERVLEGTRDHADDAVRLAVEDEALAGQLGVGVQAAAPEPFVDDHDALRPRLVLAAREGPAAGGREVEHLEEIVRHERAAHALRLSPAGQVNT